MNGLFKYFPADLCKLEKLAGHQILLTPPKYFNDPWDFLVQRAPASEEEIRELFENFEKERAAKESDTRLMLPVSFVMKEKEERFNRFKAAVTRREFLEQEGPHMQEGLSKLFGVISLTPDPLNRLMWAHYADAHRGFVVEFAHTQEREAQGFHVAGSPFGLALKVVYEPKLSKLKPDFSNAAEIYSTKHHGWAYEEEWRVILPLIEATPETVDRRTLYLLSFKPEYLLRIIFGLRVDPKIEARLLEMLKLSGFAHVEKEKIKIDATSGELSRGPF